MKNEKLRIAFLLAIGAGAFMLTFAASLLPLTSAPVPANVENSDGSLLHDVARVTLLGRAVENAQQAARWGRRENFVRATQQLRQLGAAETAVTLAGEVALGRAERLVQRAMQRDQTLSGLGLQTPEEAMSGRTAELYREALQADPKFDSADPMKLNALGYFLADKGESDEDFETAGRLTRRAVALWTEVLEQMEPDNPRRLGYEYYRAQLARDSLAWALFKQGRHDEARREQEEAVTVARRVAGLSGGRVRISADLYYHLGEIYRALGRYQDARRQFRAALSEEGNHAESLRALEELGGSPGESTPLPNLPPVPGEDGLDDDELFDNDPFDAVPLKPDVVPVMWKSDE